jgi:hypothetical protein
MNRVLGSLLVSGIASVVFTSALVVAQSPKPEFVPTPISPAKKPVSNNDTPPRPQAGIAAKAIEAKPAAARKALVNVRAANLDNLIANLINQGRPAMRAELIFVREICRLEKEPFRLIAQDAELALKRVATTLAESQQQGRMPVQAPKGQTPRSRNLDGLAVLREELESLMKKHLTSDQFAEYQTEVEKRNASRKQAAIHYLVNAMDQDLCLSDEQRIKLTESLSSRWEESWSTVLEDQLFGNRFQPIAIDPLVIPYLNATQRKLWQGTQKVGGIRGFFGMWGGFLHDDDALEEERGEVKQARPEAQIEPLRKQMSKKAIIPPKK